MTSDSQAVQKVPMFPLGVVLLPGSILPLHIFEDRYKQLSQHCIESQSQFGVVLIERGQEVGGGDERASVGCLAEIIQSDLMPDGRSNLLVLGTSKIDVQEWHLDAPYPIASVVEVHEASDDTSILRGRKVLRQFSNFVQKAKLSGYELPEIDEDAMAIGLEATELSYRIADLLPAGPFDRQRMLAASGSEERLTVIEDHLEGLEEILDTRR